MWLRDHYRQLRDAGVAEVYGLSSQSVSYQQELASRLRLPFPMLSDPDLHLASLGLPTFEAGGLRLYQRLTLIVCDGEVEHVFHPVVEPARHTAQVAGLVRAAPRRSLARRPACPGTSEAVRSMAAGAAPEPDEGSR